MIEGKIAEIEEYLESKRSDADDIESKIARLNKELKDTQESNKEEISKTGQELAEFRKNTKEQTDILKKELNYLRVEVNELTEKKAMLQIKNEELVRKSVEFKRYEETAVATLKAKESSLIEREKALQQRESLNPQKGILPPR